MESEYKNCNDTKLDRQSVKNLQLIEVTKDSIQEQKVLSHLAIMYCYEWSQYNLIDVNEDGEYEFEQYISSYWTRPERHAFLVRADSKWAGFALIDKDFIIHKEYDYSMGEFFIMHKYRRDGIGKYLATAMFDRFPGRWELGRNPKNHASVAFWDRVVKEYTHNQYKMVLSCPQHVYADGTFGDVLSFDSISCKN